MSYGDKVELKSSIDITLQTELACFTCMDKAKVSSRQTL